MMSRWRGLVIPLSAVLTSATSYAAPEKASRQLAEDQACAAAHVRAQLLKRDTPDKLLERRAALRSCSSSVCAPSIVEACSGWLRETESLVPSLRVRVLDAHGAVVTDASIRVDGKGQTVGTLVELDPGEHTIVVAVASTTESRTIFLRPGEQQHALDIMIPADPTTPAKSASKEPGVPTAAWVFLGIGGATAVGGGVLAALAQGYDSDDDHCPNQNCPTKQDAEERNARVFGFSAAAGIGFGLSAIAVGVGLITMLSSHAPSSRVDRLRERSSHRVAWTLGVGWIAVGGAFP